MTWNHLRLEERIELEGALRAGDTQAAIAARLGRSAGTLNPTSPTGSGFQFFSPETGCSELSSDWFGSVCNDGDLQTGV
jgi:hypothetical protein